jgi:hypothetical protein
MPPRARRARRARRHRVAFRDLFFTTTIDRLGPHGLGHVRRGGRIFRLNVNAAHCCRRRRDGVAPDLLNTAMFNHSCTADSVRIGRPAHCTFPCAVVYTMRTLAAGRPLLWDYDGARPSGGFKMGPGPAAGPRLADTAPGARSGLRPLRLPGGPAMSRWFPIDPGS